MRATYNGSHQMVDSYSRKVRYGRLLDEAARDKKRNLNLSVHRFKAVGRGKCIGFFSTLGMAFGEVDQAVGKLGAGPWTEVKVTTMANYVEDLVAKRIYVRMATKVPDDGYDTSLSPGLGGAIEMPEVMAVEETMGQAVGESDESSE